MKRTMSKTLKEKKSKRRMSGAQRYPSIMPGKQILSIGVRFPTTQMAAMGTLQTVTPANGVAESGRLIMAAMAELVADNYVRLVA